jgi:hypothetical protein
MLNPTCKIELLNSRECTLLILCEPEAIEIRLEPEGKVLIIGYDGLSPFLFEETTDSEFGPTVRIWPQEGRYEVFQNDMQIY